MVKLGLLLSALMLGVCLLRRGDAERDFNFNDGQVPILEPKDEPSPEVRPYSQNTDGRNHPYTLQLAQCYRNEPQYVLSLVLKKYDWSELSEEKQTKLLNKLSSFFAIPKEFINVQSVSKRDMYEMQKHSIKHSNIQTQGIGRLGCIDLVLGCGFKYFDMAEPIINQIGAQMHDGALDNIAGVRFGWWILWRKRFQPRTERMRRQVEGSGEEDDDDYDYEYDDEEETNADTVTEIPTVTTHAHRHHHGVAKDENEATGTPTPEDNLPHGANHSASSTTQQSQLAVDGSSPSNTVSSSSPLTTTPSPSAAVLPDATTPTITTTDYVEPRIENTPPIIRARLQKLAVTSGKSFSFVVPQETFYDNEDLTNLRLELTDRDGHELKPTSWLQFNAATREVYGLPLDDAVSRWTYRLTATDSGNDNVTETLEISVQQHRGVRSVNHEVSIAVKVNEKNVPSIDWQLKLVRAIASTLGDETPGAIVVREIRQTAQDPHSATLVYFNETLPTSECPEADLNNLVRQLDASLLSELVYPTLGVKSITGQLVGTCQKIHITKPKPTTHTAKNQPPVPRNQVDRVNASVGHLLVFKVPGDTFYDSSDNELTLSLKSKDNSELSPRHWLQFDSKNQEFYGIPKSGDIGSDQYNLVAEDSGGLTATDALVVVVSHAPKKDFSVYFKAFLDVPHEQFNADLQRKFVERISHLFGDRTTSLVQIRSITTNHDSDGTIVNFYNTTLYKTHNRCPEQEMEAARNVYLMQDSVLRDSVKKALGPELNLTNVQVNPLGLCHPQTDITHREFIPTKTEEPSLKSAFGENYLTTYVIPAIIIVSIVLLAAIIACCLHRCRRKSGKMELGDEEERKSFRTKGIPVIFQDELDEKPEIGNKSPIILKDEKPPLLPPSYNTSNMNGDNDVDEYVPPPAVIVGGREARGKSPATPSYRKPPPYVSP